jgi:hypothetical protein
MNESDLTPDEDIVSVVRDFQIQQTQAPMSVTVVGRPEGDSLMLSRRDRAHL